MREITIPAPLWPFDQNAVYKRPWWIAAGRTPGGVRYIRLDGEHYDIPESATVETVQAALARRDARKPIPMPPPAENQVWAWYNGKRLVKRIIIASQMTVDGDNYSVDAIVWSEPSVPTDVWPPKDAQLIGGPFAPWSPGDGMSLAEMAA